MRRIKSLLTFPGAVLTFAADPDPRALSEVETVAAGTPTGPDAGSLLLSSHVDVVLISTPPSTHESFIRMAVEAGVRHVLVEKPMTMDGESARRMAGLADATGTTIKVGSNLRRFGEIESLVRLVRSGKLGMPLKASFHIGHSGTGLASWARDPQVAGGGTLLDNGVHIIDLARFLGLLGKRYRVVSAHAGWIRSGVDQLAAFEVASHHELGGVEQVVSMEFSTSWIRTDGFYLDVAIQGTDGSVTLQVGNPSLLKYTGKHSFSTRFHKAYNSWEADTHDFLRAVVRNTGVAPTASDGAEVLAVVDTVYALARAGEGDAR
jgi:predicted dehydrogenase